jgi:hypothetical protein
MMESATAETLMAEMGMRPSWDEVNRPKYRDHTWSPEQRQAIDLIKSGISHEDEENRTKVDVGCM